jgi:hypothetical protein
MKIKIRVLKRKTSEIFEKSTKKIELKEIESFLNNLMQSIFISKKSLYRLFQVKKKT